MRPRQDTVVVLARGASLRMGKPKGLLSCPATAGRKFLETIVKAYQSCGLSGLVVTTADLAKAHQAVLEATPEWQMAIEPAGGETGLTIWYGWQTVSEATTHLWAHPVDMPLVSSATLEELRRCSMAEPDLIVRPSWQGQAGHPVILPVAQLSRLDPDQLQGNGTMRAVLAKAEQRGLVAPTQMIEVADEGVITDFDEPDDLVRYGGCNVGENDGSI